jgi:hypothetical protein
MTKKSFITATTNILSKANEQKNSREDFIKQSIMIDEELKSLIPPLSTEEKLKLEANIVAEGCREALILWNKDEEYILIDGHNRYEICTRLQIPFKILEKEFEDKEAVKNWMISNQLGKRNLTELQKSYLRGLQYAAEKRKLGGIGVNQHNKSKVDKMSTQQKTIEKLAEQHFVSAKTIQRDEKFALGLNRLSENNTQFREDFLNKKVKVPVGIIQRFGEDINESLTKEAKNIVKEGKYKDLIKLLNPTEEILEDNANLHDLKSYLIQTIKTIEDEQKLKQLELMLKTIL